MNDRPTTSLRTIRDYLPLIVLAGTLVAAGAVGQMQVAGLTASAGELKEAIENNEVEIDRIIRELAATDEGQQNILIGQNRQQIAQIVRDIIQREGAVELKLQELRSEQRNHNEKLEENAEQLDDIILLLRQIQNEARTR